MKRVAVVGGGVSGLAAALRMSAAGYEVHLFEKEERCGGKAGECRIGSYRFDTGPSILTMPHVLVRLFDDAGLKFDEFCPLVRLDENCRYFFSDGTVLRAYNDVRRFADEAAVIHADPREVECFLAYCRRIFTWSADFFLYRSITELKSIMSIAALRALAGVIFLDPLRSMKRAIASYISDNRLRKVFARYATYNGSDPSRAPATFNLIAHVELDPGGYLPARGMRSVADSLIDACTVKGVVFHCNAQVHSIIVEGKRVKGVRTCDGEFLCDAVISAVDVLATYRDMLGRTHHPVMRYYERAERSLSAVVYLLCVRGIHDAMGVHSLIFSDDYDEEFRQLFGENRVPADPTLYFYISSRVSHNDAPEGCENWMVVINAPPHGSQNWNEEKNRLRTVILDKAARYFGLNAAAEIEAERFFSPAELGRLAGNGDGNLYGPSSNSMFSAFLRQQNRSRRYRGLYFCGGSAHPGGGVPLAVQSGIIAADLLRRHG